MIEIPLLTLVEAGIKDVILITGGNRPGDFLELLKNGKSIGLERLYYTYQEGAGGISEALSLAEPFLEEEENCIVLLGDNYFEDGIRSQFLEWIKKPFGAGIFLQETKKPWDFGVAEVVLDKIISIEEKPKVPKSNLAVLGCYMFDKRVWNFIKRTKPSSRGEMEITDVLSLYLKDNSLFYFLYNGYWNDMGRFESWMEVSQRVRERWKSPC